MSADSLRPGGSQTEYRLLKPMPSLQSGDSAPAAANLSGGWDSQLRRLFPPLKTPAADLPSVAGIRLGHFILEDRIGRGGMGSVFRAQDTGLDRVIALKVLSPDQLREPAAIQRFQNEARLAAKLDHENIARVFFVGEEKGVHFIAFEYVRGTTIRDLIARKGTLTPDEAVNYALQTAEALKQTSAAGMVHRDIKPSNLIVTPSGRLKLVDLGLARTLGPEGDQELTVTGTTLGTFDYISPEQARDPRNVDVRSDIYSLGCTMYHMLTGTAPYASSGTLDKLLKHSTGVAPDAAERNPRVPARLSLVVQRMMATNPDERYATPEALIEELTDVAESLGLRAVAPEGTIWRTTMYDGSRRWDQHRGWLIGLAVIVFLAVAGGDVYRWMQGFRPDAGRNGSPRLADSSRRADRTGSRPETPSRSAEATPPSEDNTPPNSPLLTQTPPASPLTTDAATSTTMTPPAVVPESTDSGNGIGTPMPPAMPGPMNDDVNALSAANVAAGAGALTTKLVEPLPRTTASTDPISADSGGAMRNSTPGTPPVTGTEPPRAAAVSDSPFVVTTPTGEISGRFPTLEAACAAATTGSVIDVDFDGPVPRPQKPIVIQNKRLTIRPAIGKRPQLTFVPGDILQTSGDLRMIQMNGGALELFNLDLVMEVTPEVYADRWIFLSLAQVGQVTMRQVTVTVINPGWRRAAIIERRPAGNTPVNMMPSSEAIREAEVLCEDCLFRGGAVFYHDRTVEPGSIKLSEVGLALADTVLFVEGADRLEMDSSMRVTPALRCQFDHLTAVTEGSFLHLLTGESRESSEIQLEFRNSIVDTLSSSQPTFLLEGHQHSDTLLQRVTCTGDYNVFSVDSRKACLVRGSLPLPDDEWQYSLEQWRTQWQPRWEPAGDVVSSRRILVWDQDIQLRRGNVTAAHFSLLPVQTDDGQPLRVASPTDRSDPGYRPSQSALRRIAVKPDESVSISREE